MPTYHAWMQDPALLASTGSEPLTLEQEYAMQQTWREDSDSRCADSPELTFIVLARTDPSLPLDASVLCTQCPMAGDVNVFFQEEYANEDDTHPTCLGELEVMIAEPTFRRQGLADEALRLLCYYILTDPTPAPAGSEAAPTPFLPLAPTQLVVRIGDENIASLALFHRLGFVTHKHNTVFHETELRVQHAEAISPKKPLAVLAWDDDAL